MDKWVKQYIDDPELKELCENFYYYKRKMGDGPATIKNYDANVFICIFDNKEQLISNWDKINYFIAFRVQNKVEKIIEKSNFYICLFANEAVGSEEKSKIQGNSFCAKKYVFEERLIDEEEYLKRVESKIFSLEIEEAVGDVFKINRIELQNFRRYEGNLQIDLTGKNKKPAAFTLIYAKNGYGKTSIFDGIEYVFKGEVERIVDLTENNRDLPLKGAIYHNKNCADKLAYSQIELEGGKIIKRNVSKVQEGKNDCRLNQLGKNFGLNIIGTTQDNEKWNQMILPHDKIDTFISAHTPTERYKEWIESAPELSEEQKIFIESYKAVREKDKSLKKVKEEIEKLQKELKKIEKSKMAVAQLSELCKKYNGLAKNENILLFDEKNSNLNEYNSLLNKIMKMIRHIKNEILPSYDFKLAQGEQVRNGEIKDAESLESILESTEDKKKKYISQEEKHTKYVNLKNDVEEIEEKIIELKKQKNPLDIIHGLGTKRVEEEKNKYLELSKEIEEIGKTVEYFDAEEQKIVESFSGLTEKINEIKKLIDSKEMMDLVEEKIKSISQGKKEILLKTNDIQKIKEDINKFVELIKLRKIKLERVNTFEIPKNVSGLSTLELAGIEMFLSNEEQIQLKRYEESWRELKKELEVREEIQNQENEITEKTKEICDLGIEFLLNHREQTSCPLCKEPFANWNELFERVSRAEKNNEKENQQKRQLIIDQINELDIQYERFYNLFVSKKENKRVKLIDQIIENEREKNDKEIQLGKLEIETENLNKKIQLNKEWLEEQDIILDEYSMGAWRICLEKKKLEYQKLQQQKIELEKKVETLQRMNQNNKERIDSKINLKKGIVEDSKLYSMIIFLINKSEEFDVEFERDYIIEQINLLKAEEQKKKNDLIQYEDYAQVDVESIKQKISECDMKIMYLQGVKKQADIFENFSPEGIEKNINTWKKEKKNYEEQLELLYEMQEESGARAYFERYTTLCKNIAVQNKNMKDKNLQKKEAEKKFDIEKEKLENKLKAYFSQTIMNEIYQKIDPHDIMKNVTYHLNFNEKDEPQLFIEVREEEKADKEFYRPETYFSTAQLNTVAFSSFFGRALSANNLPVKVICVDDPIGHFDDMNILGFTDMIRSILEKQDCQIIMSTHDEKVYQIMKRKLDTDYYNTSFIQLENSEKVVWDKEKC